MSTIPSKAPECAQPRITDQRLAGQAAARLAGSIARGEWHVGDRLPNERELSEQLGVGRTSIREALRLLAARGYIRTRPGQGTYVASRQPAETPLPFADWNRRHEYTIEEMLDTRKILEGRVAELAAVRADATDLARLRAAMDDLALACRRQDLVAMVDADTRFHEALTHAAGNRLLARMLHSILSFQIEARRITLGIPGRSSLILDRHQDILNAVAAGDARASKTAALAHAEDLHNLGVPALPA